MKQPADGKKHNIYGREKFTPIEARHYLQNLIALFKDYFSTLGYQEVAPVPISSGIDPTVRFVGSHISVLKGYLRDDNVPDPGVYINQNCIRTRNISKFYDDDYFPVWGSFFPSIGALVPPNRLTIASNEVLGFFENILAIPAEHLLIRVRSEDSDLLRVAEQLFPQERVEIDSRTESYYRHKFGITGVWGRNLNIALRKPSGINEFSDVGNIIIIENQEKQLAVEIALGTTTILKELHSLDHVQDCTPVLQFPAKNEGILRKLEDSLIVSTVLFSEGLRPSAKNNETRILRRYLESISHFRTKLNFSIEKVQQVILQFILTQMPAIDSVIADEIVTYVQTYENDSSNN